MTDERQQSFANHARYFPLFHFFAFPIVLFYALFQVYVAVRDTNVHTLIYAIFTLGIAAAVLASRNMAVTVQDRLIRLEETLRMQRVLPAELQGEIAKLSPRQFVALRFASDADLPDLVRRVAAGELTDQKSIKTAVKTWRADWLRA